MKCCRKRARRIAKARRVIAWFLPGARLRNPALTVSKRVLAQIKSEFPDKEICVSTGFVTNEGAVELKQAGLDRLNHNLNTSEAHYPQYLHDTYICRPAEYPFGRQERRA